MTMHTYTIDTRGRNVAPLFPRPFDDRAMCNKALDRIDAILARDRLEAERRELRRRIDLAAK